MKVLALVESRDHVCCRYRVRAFASTLAASGWSLAIEPLARGPFRRFLQFREAEGYDTILLQRKLLPAWQLGELRRRSRRLIFDFDDAVLYRDSNDPRGPHDRRRVDRFKRTVSLADQVIAGNAFLADCATRAGAAAERVRVIPTCIAAGSTTPRPRTGREGGIDLTWIGSASTLAGLERQRPLWERLGEEFPGLRLRMVCDRFLRLDPLPVVEIPWSQESEETEIASADVGISWIPDDLWSRGKCGLKILQYQAAGLPVVANPVGVHPELIRHGVDGFLATTTEDWVEAIRTLSGDRSLREAMGREARKSLAARYSIEAWASTFLETIRFPGKSSGSSPLTSQPGGSTLLRRRTSGRSTDLTRPPRPFQSTT